MIRTQQKKFTAMAVTALAAFATACSPAKNNENDGKVHIAADAAMDGDQLAQAGEQLMSPYTFMLADKVFDMALAKDPTNQRAGFYRALLKPMMVLKGGYTRVRPFVAANADVKQYDGALSNVPYSPLRDFVTVGRQDIATVHDVQTAFDQHITALIELYTYLKANENLSLTLNINPSLFAEELKNQSSEYCSVVENTDHSMQVVCDYRELLQRKVGVADMIAIRQLVAGELMYEILANSYSEDGMDQIVKAEMSQHLTEEQLNARLSSTPAYGLLRATNHLSMIRELGSDTSAAWHYVLAHQSELCPAQAYPWDPVRRKGYVFENGLCYNAAESQQPLEQFDAALKGPIMVTPQHPETQPAFRLDVFALVDHPVADLKTEFPTAYDACGNPTTWRDPSFGGVLPDGNGNRLSEPNHCAR